MQLSIDQRNFACLQNFAQHTKSVTEKSDIENGKCNVAQNVILPKISLRQGRLLFRIDIQNDLTENMTLFINYVKFYKNVAW